MVRRCKRDGKPLIGAVVLAGSRSPAAAPGTAGAGHHGPGESRLRAGRARGPGAFERAVSEQRRGAATRCIRSRARASSSCRCIAASPIHRCASISPVSSRSAATSTTTCSRYIVVTTAPFFGRTDQRGNWSAPDLPAGRYRVRVWHPLLNEAADASAWSKIGEQRAERSISDCRMRCAPPRSPVGRIHGTTDAQVRCARGAAACWRRRRPRAHAGDWELALDLRAVYSDGRESFLDNGQGKLRFDEDHEGIQLGRLRAAWNQSLGEVFAAHVEASTWDDDDKNPIDLTEAYLEYRPYPRAGLRSRVRLGAFYPPMSLESRAVGWETPYTITPSAISRWIGEEMRTIGLEGQVDWLGTRPGHDFDLQFTAALFGWNDPAGTMLAAHGFALHDRQTTLFGRVGAPQPDIEQCPRKNCSTKSTDGRVTTSARRCVTSIAPCSTSCTTTIARTPPRRRRRYATSPGTRAFDAAALRIETGNGWTVLVQALDGRHGHQSVSCCSPGSSIRSPHWSPSARTSTCWPRATTRSRSYSRMTRPRPAAKTATPGRSRYSFDTRRPLALRARMAARRRATCRRAPRTLAEPAFATESKVELSARYSLGSRLLERFS